MRLASPGRLPIADLDKQIASSISSGTRYPTVRRGPPRITHFHIHTSSDTWRLDVPMAGIDPNDVVIEVAGNTISIRAEHSSGSADGEMRYEQSMTVPQFLDLERLAATHRHGMLELTVPIKDSVKPRRIQIEGVAEPQRQIAATK